MTLKHVKIIGCISFVLYAILSIVFYKERTVFTDIAFHIFHFSKDGEFAIQNNRYGAFFTQVIPVLATNMGVSLNSVMLLYSISFIAYYFIIFYLCVYVFKQSHYGLLLVLFLLLFVSHTFFWVQSELPQGIGFLIMLFAFYSRFEDTIHKNVYWKAAFAFNVTFLALFHPLLISPLLFILIFKWVESGKKYKFKYYSLLVFLFLLVSVIKSTMLKTSGYEASAMSGLKNFITLFPNYFNIESNRNFLANCFHIYYFIPILLLFTCAHYLKTKQIIKLTIQALSFIMYLMLVNISYFDVRLDYYIENLYLPLTIIILVPFLFDVLPSYTKIMGNSVVVAIVIIGIVRIFFTSNTYTSRLNWMEEYLEKNKGRKLFVDSKAVPMDTLLTAWGTPYEFWLLSTSKTGKSASIYVVEDSIANFFYHLPDNKKVFLTYERYPYSEINDGKYFNFQDTSNYKIITVD